MIEVMQDHLKADHLHRLMVIHSIIFLLKLVLDSIFDLNQQLQS